MCIRDRSKIVDVKEDFTLCKFDNPITLDNGNKFERFATTKPKSGDRLLLIGYGCQSQCQLDRSCPGVYGELRAGLASVSSSPGFVRNGGTRNDRFDVAANDAYVCPGDSGGAAYARKTGSNSWANRHIVGVNSMVGPGKDENITSFIADSSTSTFLVWARDWARQNQAEICGITADAKNCKSR